MVAISSGREIGVDAEQLIERRYTLHIARKYFQTWEQSQSLFYRAWTARESFAKLLGRGLANVIARTRVKAACDDMLIGLDEDFSHRVNFMSPVNGYLAAVCRSKDSSKDLELLTYR